MCWLFSPTISSNSRTRASNGSKLWVKGTSGARFGLGSGNFYSTPAVAFGRVYMGNTDGRVYSFTASSGETASTCLVASSAESRVSARSGRHERRRP